MRPKLNLKDKDQMSTPNQCTDNFKSNLTCIFLFVRGKLKKTLCPWTLCIKANMKIHVASVHENKRPFKCEICDYSCSIKGNMKIHVTSFHEDM